MTHEKTIFDESVIYNGDCLEVMKDIADKSVDCVICDLPYGTTVCKWDSVIPFEPLWKEYKRIIKDNGAICLFGCEPFSSQLRMSNLNMYKYDWYWEKSKATNFLNSKKQPLRCIESISIFYNSQPIYHPQMVEGEPYNKGYRSDKYQDVNRDSTTGTYKSSYIANIDGKRYPKNKLYFKTAESEGNVVHPTQKPVALLEYLVKTYTNENEIVLDNCSGSGSTAVACKNTKRRFICIEKDKNYYDLSVERLKKAYTKKHLF